MRETASACHKSYQCIIREGKEKKEREIHTEREIEREKEREKE